MSITLIAFFEQHEDAKTLDVYLDAYGAVYPKSGIYEIRRKVFVGRRIVLI